MARAEAADASRNEPPTNWAGRARLVGPGLIAAATGVGAGDIVAALSAGAQFGLVLLWAILLGAAIKFALAEGVGRWHLASGSTILEGWKRLGRWTMVYFGIYIVVWGFSFGAAAMSATALPLNALFPVFSVRTWGMIAGVTGFCLVVLGQYGFFEKLMTALVGVMFVTVLGSAIAIGVDFSALSTGLVPTLPDGSIVYVLGLLGGVGGSITLAAYGYWLREKGWRRPPWLPMMRFDNAIAYVITGVFVIAMLVMGAGLLHGTDQEIGGTAGIVDFAASIEARLGSGVRLLFLVGFLAAAMTSLLGVWNGVSLLFADFVRVWRDIPDDEAEPHIGESSTMFRLYVAWLTFPPMALLFLDRPIALVLTYAALGAVFMPFLAITLLWLLNRDVDTPHRNGWLSNSALVAATLLFAVLALDEIRGLF